jgi:hypothetical protein
VLPLALSSALAVLQPALADTYGAARTELVAAYEAKDYTAMQEAANRALAARPGYPVAMFNLALARVLGGDASGSLAILEQLVAQQIEPGVDDLPEFAPLKALPGWIDYTAESAALSEPVGNAEIAWRHDAGDFIPEGIAVAPGGHSAWVGSIRYGTIRRVGDGAGLTAPTSARRPDPPRPAKRAGRRTGQPVSSRSRTVTVTGRWSEPILGPVSNPVTSTSAETRK